MTTNSAATKPVADVFEELRELSAKWHRLAAINKTRGDYGGQTAETQIHCARDLDAIVAKHRHQGAESPQREAIENAVERVGKPEASSLRDSLRKLGVIYHNLAHDESWGTFETCNGSICSQVRAELAAASSPTDREGELRAAAREEAAKHCDVLLNADMNWQCICGEILGKGNVMYRDQAIEVQRQHIRTLKMFR
jgi:hypothetical protein